VQVHVIEPLGIRTCVRVCRHILASNRQQVRSIASHYMADEKVCNQSRWWRVLQCQGMWKNRTQNMIGSASGSTSDLNLWTRSRLIKFRDCDGPLNVIDVGSSHQQCFFGFKMATALWLLRRKKLRLKLSD